jgi:hypothetical protein
MQSLGIVDVVQECRELLLPVPARCFAYPLERTGHAPPTLRPGRVLFVRIPFRQPPSLRRLRCRCPGLVRRLLGYYGAV